MEILPSVSYIRWDNVSDDDIEIYQDYLDDHILNFWDDVLSCNRPNCKSEDHHNQLNNIYEILGDLLVLCSDHFQKSVTNANFKVVPGWNLYCQDLYKKSRECFLKGHNSGRIRSGIIFENMKSSRKFFKNALNYVSKNEINIRKQALLEKFRCSNKNIFCKEIKKLNKNKENKSPLIDDESDPRAIAAIFDNKYKKVLKSIESQTVSGFEEYDLDIPQNIHFFSNKDLNDAILRVKSGCGWDGIHSNHLKYSGPVFRNYLLKFFNKLLSHGFVPIKMLRGEIKPRVKNTSASKATSKNYRPIMDSSIILKILEYCILPKAESFLSVDVCQFAYRKNISGISAVTILKETIMSYNNSNDDVHCAMLDLSQAFDQINFEILRIKLINSGMPIILVDIIEFMMKNLYVCTKYGKIRSDDWKKSNGTRQGGVISPLIFSYYINDLIKQVKDLSVGCRIGFQRTSILCFADDIVLSAPSATGLHLLVNKTSSIIEKLFLKINVEKSQYIVFKYRKLKYVNSTVELLGNSIPRVASCKYLGITLDENFNCKEDINRAMNSFLKQFNGIFHKFNFLNMELLSFLSKSYCTSFYGMDYGDLVSWDKSKNFASNRGYLS